MMLHRRASSRVFIGALVIVPAAAMSLAPQPAPRPQGNASAAPGLFDPWQWRSIGPRLGGRSIASHGSVSRPMEYYFGATGGGLWKTTDGGVSWAPVTDGFLSSSSVGAIGVCAANPDVVYIGTGEGQWRAQMNTGDGAYASRDAGKTWKPIGLQSSSGQTAITRMRVHPTDCNTVYAAVLGDPYGPNPERGVFRSTDGGATWTRVLHRSDRAGVSDLVIDPSDPRTLYATVWDAVRPPWGGVTGTGSGIFKTTDGGDNWTELTRKPGLPKGRVGKIGIAVSGADRNRVYAVIEADPDSAGVFRSNDGGATWERTNGDNALAHRAEYYVRIIADPKLVDRIYVLGRNVYRSDDAGKTFRTISTPHGDDHDIWIDPTNSNRMIESNDGGANVTTNGGQSWTGRSYTTSQIYHVIATNDFPYLVCGAQQDNSSKCLPSDGDGGFWYLGPAGEQGYIAMHPTRTTLGYGGSQRGGLVRYDRATGQKQDIDIWPDMSDGERPNQLKERFQWTFPIVMSPQDPNVVYAASQHVWRTRNGGLSWDRISPDLTRADPKTLVGMDMPINDHSGTDYYATVFTIGLSKLDPNVIWSGSDDGRVYVTRNGGTNWTNVTPRDLPDFAKASLITTSPHAPGKAYLAAEKYKLQDIAPYIFKTEDYGRTWTRIVNGIAKGDFVRAVREDPVRPGLLFAGTEHAPYVSFDDGANWHRLALNLPDVQVADVDIKDNDVLIATFGRGIYVLDDISPLRELAGGALPARPYLFKPAPAIRTAASQAGGADYTRTVTPGANAINVYYSLAQPAQRVTIDVLDARGQVVRSYTGTPTSKPRPMIRNSLGHAINGPRWGSATPDPVVPVAAGLHRVAWDLRYPPATDFPGLRLRDTNVDGPQVLPGDYRVRLTVDGTRLERPVKVLRDPRLTDVTAAQLAAQFAFSKATHARLNDATSAVARIRDLKQQIADRLKQTSDAVIGATARDVDAKLSGVEREVYEVRVAAESDIKHFGPKLTNKLANVYAVASGADAPPTKQAQTVFGDLSTKLGVQLDRLSQIAKSDIVKLNDLLRKANLAPIGSPYPVM
jgi:photosystem II stability/assembly factor-like uncharacterized protein